MTDFAHNLNTMLESQGDVPVAASPVAEPVSAADAAAPVAEAAPADAPKAPPTVRKINGPAAEPIELSDVANTAMMKKALPFVGGLVLLLLILRRLAK